MNFTSYIDLFSPLKLKQLLIKYCALNPDFTNSFMDFIESQCPDSIDSYSKGEIINFYESLNNIEDSYNRSFTYVMETEKLASTLNYMENRNLESAIDSVFDWLQKFNQYKGIFSTLTLPNCHIANKPLWSFLLKNIQKLYIEKDKEKLDQLFKNCPETILNNSNNHKFN